jgi:hypothetical protein
VAEPTLASRPAPTSAVNTRRIATSQPVRIEDFSLVPLLSLASQGLTMPKLLSRNQRNHIFLLVREMGLDPMGFSESNVIRDGQPTWVIAHPQTDAHFQIQDSTDGGWWLSWWPNLPRGGVDRAHTWDDVMRSCARWLDSVRRDYEAPDLWGELAKGKTISEAADNSEEARPFTASELRALGTALKEIEVYVITTQALGEPEKKLVRRRFAYLLEAAKAGVRKVDWLNIFVAQIIAMVTTGLVDPAFYGPMMIHAATVLNAIFQFGIKLLH